RPWLFVDGHSHHVAEPARRRRQAEDQGDGRALHVHRALRLAGEIFQQGRLSQERRRPVTDLKATVFRWTDRACLPLMALMAAATSALNYYALHNFHTIEKHLVFRERILHGFATTDIVPTYAIPPTFPMWGYGFVLLLTTNKVWLIVLQFAVALF